MGDVGSNGDWWSDGSDIKIRAYGHCSFDFDNLKISE